MIRILGRNILRLLVVVLLQVFIINNIEISSLVNPYFYVIFILLLPFETPGWVLLSSSFALGLTMDLFMNTPGLHAASCVFMAFLRPQVLSMISPRDGFDPGSFPRLYYYGFNWFLKYSLILVFTHHLVLFYIEVFRFSGFFHTLLKVVLSTVLSVILIVISQYFIFRK
jgi:rod shape-determining protein MreD